MIPDLDLMPSTPLLNQLIRACQIEFRRLTRDIVHTPEPRILNGVIDVVATVLKAEITTHDQSILLIGEVFAACDVLPASLAELAEEEYANAFKSWLKLAILLVDATINGVLEADEYVNEEMNFWFGRCIRDTAK